MLFETLWLDGGQQSETFSVNTEKCFGPPSACTPGSTRSCTTSKTAAAIQKLKHCRAEKPKNRLS